jgi:hypothetical protein
VLKTGPWAKLRITEYRKRCCEYGGAADYQVARESGKIDGCSDNQITNARISIICAGSAEQKSQFLKIFLFLCYQSLKLLALLKIYDFSHQSCQFAPNYGGLLVMN